MPKVTIKIAPQGTGFRDGSNLDMSITVDYELQCFQ